MSALDSRPGEIAASDLCVGASDRCDTRCRVARWCALPVPQCLDRDSRLAVARSNDQKNRAHERERKRLMRVRVDPPETFDAAMEREFERRTGFGGGR